MSATFFHETRESIGFKVSPARHFYFHGTVYRSGTGRGNFAGVTDSGAMVGTVKVTILANGRVSLRSIGAAGNGRLVHVSQSATLTVDGVDYTAREYIAALMRDALK